MRIAVLDDYADTIRTLHCFARLAGHDVVVFTDHVQDDDALAERLKDADALVLIRERTEVRASLLARLPRLRLISQRSAYPHIDVAACTRHGVVVCSNLHQGTPSYAAAELTWGLILAAARRIPEQVASLRAGRWQTAVGSTLRGKVLGLLGYGRIARALSTYAAAFEMPVVVWAREASRDAARRDGLGVAASRQELFSWSDVLSLQSTRPGGSSRPRTSR